MEQRVLKRDLRRCFGQNGWILLVYYLIMNAAVMLTVFVDEIILYIQYLLNPGKFTDDIGSLVLERASGNAWGYLLACLVGGVILLVWKKPDFCFRQIWRRAKPMTTKALLVVFCAFMSAQAFQLLLTPLLEWLLNLLGLSALASLELATAGANTVSMFLYVALFAPVFEEILFRGLILHNLLPYGKKIAIVGSAFLFGMFHGNLVQSPYAFLVGLVLGYVTVEYSIVWAIALHMFNNFILGDLAVRLSELIPSVYVDIVLYALIFGCTVATLVIAAVNTGRIAKYLSRRRIHPWCLRSFFSSAGVIFFSMVMFVNMLLLLLL